MKLMESMTTSLSCTEPHHNRGGSNRRKTKVSEKARKELEARLAMERVSSYLARKQQSNTRGDIKTNGLSEKYKQQFELLIVFSFP